MTYSSTFVRNNDNDLIICLHSSFSATNVWNDLMLHLSSNHPMTAEVPGFNTGVDHKPGKNTDLLDVQVSELTEVISRQTSRVHLIAHSFGAVVALKIAQNQPDNLASVILIEPTAIHLLRQSDREDNQHYRQVCEMSADLSGAVRRGDYWEGMKHLVNDWSGKDIWHQFDGHRKLELANAFERIPVELWSGMNNKSTFADLDRVTVPMLILCGTASPEPFRRLSCLLNEAIRSARHRTIGNAGHFLPMTHPFEIAKHVSHHFEMLAVMSSYNFDNRENLMSQQVV